MLCDFYPLYISQTRYPSTSISIPEIALIIWAGTYGIEELRQVNMKHFWMWSNERFYEIYK